MNAIEKLVKNLNILFDKLNNKCGINYGGCCFVAYIIAKELEKRELYDFNLRIYGYNIFNYSEQELRNNIINNINDVPCKHHTVSHYSIIYNNIYEINSGDNYEDSDFIDIYNLNSFDIKRIYDYGDWNYTYSISNNIYVERFIKIIFNNYDKESKTNQM